MAMVRAPLDLLAAGAADNETRDFVTGKGGYWHDK
jgi:hypothetical protein